MMRRFWFQSLILSLLIVCGAAAQVVPAGPGAAGMTAPATPETLDVWLSSVEGATLDRIRISRADSLEFGRPWPFEIPGAVDSLTVSVPWFKVRRDPSVADGGYVARIYRVGPFRLGLDRNPSTSTEVLQVTGRLAPDQAPAPVRDPWRIGRRRWPATLVIVALLCLLLWLWRLARRRGDLAIERITDPVPDPAWVRFMVGAVELAEAGLPDGSGSRPMLDRLDALLRDYLRRRYGIDAAALAPGEIDGVLAQRRYPRGIAMLFDDLMRDLDLVRYGPTDSVVPGTTRRLLDAAVVAVEKTDACVNPVDGPGGRGELAGAAALRKLASYRAGREAT